MLQRSIDGRTDLVFDFLAEGHAATSKDQRGTPLIAWCAYHGDVSAVRFLLIHAVLRRLLHSCQQPLHV